MNFLKKLLAEKSPSSSARDFESKQVSRNVIREIMYPRLETDNDQVIISGSESPENTPLAMRMSREDASPALTALALAPNRRGEPFCVFSANIPIDDEVVVVIATHDLRTNARLLLARSENRLFPEYDLELFEPLISGLYSDRAGLASNSEEANWSQLTSLERISSVEGTSIETDLVVASSDNANDPAETLAILRPSESNPSEIVLTESAWIALLTDATSRHLSGDTEILVPIAVTGSEGVRRLTRMRVKDLRLLCTEIASIITTNNYGRDDLELLPPNLAELYAMIDPYPEDVVAERKQISLGDVGETIAIEPIEVILKTDDEMSIIKDATANLDEPEEPIRADAKTEEYVPSDAEPQVALLDSEEDSYDKFFDSLDKLPTGPFRETVPVDNVKKVLEGLMSDFGLMRLSTFYGSLDYIPKINKWKFTGSGDGFGHNDGESTIEFVLTPDENDGFGIADVVLTGYSVDGDVNVKSLLSDTNALLDAIRKKIKLTTPSVKLDKIEIQEDGAMVFSGEND